VAGLRAAPVIASAERDAEFELDFVGDGGERRRELLLPHRRPATGCRGHAADGADAAGTHVHTLAWDRMCTVFLYQENTSPGGKVVRSAHQG